MRYQYDHSGRVIRIEDALGRVFERSYDGRDRITEIILRGSQGSRLITKSSYDPEVRGPVSQTDFTGQVTDYTYDVLTGDLKTISLDGATMRLSYDQFGNIHQVVDSLGNTTTFEYDALGRIIERRLEDASASPTP